MCLVNGVILEGLKNPHNLERVERRHWPDKALFTLSTVSAYYHGSKISLDDFGSACQDTLSSTLLQFGLGIVFEHHSCSLRELFGSWHCGIYRLQIVL